MVKTTKELIKVLPFEEKFREELLAKYDSLNVDQRYLINRALWETYDALYQIKLEENMQIALERAKEGKETLDKDFYRRVREHTERELQTADAAKTTHIDLAETRKKLQALLDAQTKQ